MEPIAQWTPFDLVFTAERDRDWRTFPLRVTFSRGSEELEVEGFWDGEATWRVRFAPTAPGEWRWRSFSPDPDMDGQTGEFDCVEPSPDDLDANPNYHGHIRIARTRRHFVYADGTPFFYLGDTCWCMNAARCALGKDHNGPFYVWLQDRRDKGFTVVNHRFIDSSANEGGYAFAADGDSVNWDALNPGYFEYADIRYRVLWENGFVIAGPPNWLGRTCMSLAQAKNLFRYLLARYGAYNLVIALSGEYNWAYRYKGDNPPWNERGKWCELGEFVVANNPFGHPVSIHPGPFGGVEDPYKTSSLDFHDEGWLDHNWLQSGQRPRCLPFIPEYLQTDYLRRPTKPVILAEGNYEWDNHEGASREQVRWQAWVSFLNGACGTVYGACGVWQFHDAHAAETRLTWNEDEWLEALAYAGSGDMKHVRTFFEELEWWRLQPRRDRILVNGEPPEMPTDTDLTGPHCASADNDLVVVYVPVRRDTPSLMISGLDPKGYVAAWFNPRKGTYLPVHDGQPAHPDDKGNYLLPDKPQPSQGDWVFCLRSPEEGSAERQTPAET
ncbi:MAG: DUF4038 domain-containing protein [Kiritimatiellae bacterium]|nr:DUF4038 domain-containing protein [Kiritimatiellia bacterium]